MTSALFIAFVRRSIKSFVKSSLRSLIYIVRSTCSMSTPLLVLGVSITTIVKDNFNTTTFFLCFYFQCSHHWRGPWTYSSHWCVVWFSKGHCTFQIWSETSHIQCDFRCWQVFSGWFGDEVILKYVGSSSLLKLLIKKKTQKARPVRGKEHALYTDFRETGQVWFTVITVF